MIHSAATARYARALAEVVLDPKSGMDALDVVKQIRSIEGLLEQSTDLRHALYSPAVPKPKKRAVLGHFAGELGLAPKVRNFLNVVIDHGRLKELSSIREAFEENVDEALGFVRADVTSAQTLDDGQRAAVEARLASLTGKRVRMHFAIDEQLIGGVMARIGSTVYDGSVRGQLDSLRRRLVTES